MTLTVHVYRSRERVVSTAPDDRDTRWCFTCRKHVPHTWELWEEPFPSYYDPRPVIRCPRGHSSINFGGMIDGPDLPSEDVWRVLLSARVDAVQDVAQEEFCPGGVRTLPIDPARAVVRLDRSVDVAPSMPGSEA